MARTATSCSRTTRQVILRGINIIIALIGCGLIAYGIFLLVKEKSSKHVLSSVVLSLGVLTSTLSIILAACGYKKSWFLNFFLFVKFLLLVMECTVAGFFLSTSAREKMVKSIDPPPDLVTFIDSNATKAGYVVITVLALELLSYALAGLQRRSLNDFNSDDDEPLYEDLEARATKPAKRTFGFSGTKSKPARPINSSEYEPAKSMKERAAERNREKNETILRKYGLDQKK